MRNSNTAHLGLIKINFNKDNNIIVFVIYTLSTVVETTKIISYIQCIQLLLWKRLNF